MRYQAVERALYGLGERPEAQVARPRLSVVPSPPPRYGPRSAPRESVRRLDLSIATRRLSPEELDVVKAHYILRTRRFSRREREPIVRRLISLLG